MAYITAAEVVTRLGNSAALQLTADSGTTVDMALITTIITQVQGQMDGYLRLRVAVPVEQADYPATYAALQGAAMSKVIYQLALRRPPVPKDWKEANDKADLWLKGLAEGTIDMPDAGLGGSELEYGSADQNAATTRDL